MDDAQGDDLLMSLVENALGRLPEDRGDWLRSACGGDAELFARVLSYVDAETEMKDFLARPLTACFRVADFRLAALESAFADDPFAPGELVVGRFRIARRVAEGGMGMVYEATDDRLQRRVAIKCAKAGFGNRLPPEVRHAREISHPNVCRIFDIHTASTAQGEIDFLTMEFLEGQTLAERLKAGPLAAPAARAIANQLCEGLAEAHRNYVVHGDLKSNNVILVRATPGAPERAVITDFGLARSRNKAGEASSSAQMASAPVGGAPGYMAPELSLGAKPSTASDVYALGAILRELVSGPRSAVFGRWAFRRWNAAIAKCLDPDPPRRFVDGVALRQALRPPLTRRWALGAVAATMLAASVSGVATFQRATAPKQMVRLALLPFQSAVDAADPAARLSHDTSARLAQLRGNAETKVVFVEGKGAAARQVDTVEKARMVFSATHVVQGRLEAKNPGTEDESDVLHVYLTDTESGVNKKEWTVQYKPAELRYAPVALAGMVTNSLNLPPLMTSATVINAAARQDYTTALSYMKGDIRPDDDIHLMKRVVMADPASALGYAGLAEAQSFKSRVSGDPVWTEKARESVRQAELRDPDLPEVHMIAGWLEKTSGHYEVAEAHFLRVIAIQRDNADAWRRLGQTYESGGHASEALDALKKALQFGPSGFRNHRELGVFYYRNNKFPEAVAEFGKMATLAPGLAESHRLLGETYYQMMRYREAESELAAGIRIQDTASAEQSLGAIFWDEKNDREAVERYLKALALGPQTSSLWLSLSFCYTEEGLQSKARDAFRRGLAASGKALAQDPRSGREHAMQAYFEAKLNDLARAETDADEALKLSQDDYTIQFAVLTYEAIGHRVTALSLLDGSPVTASEMSRYPGLEELRKDPRYTKLLDVKHIQ